MSEQTDAGIGHNSVAGKDLKKFIERIERTEEEIKGLRDDVRDIYAEAKGTGYDVKILRKIIARRKLDPDQLAEQDALLDTYEGAIGAFA